MYPLQQPAQIVRETFTSDYHLQCTKGLKTVKSFFSEALDLIVVKKPTKTNVNNEVMNI